MELTVCEISRTKPKCKSNWPDFDYIRIEIVSKIEPSLRKLFEDDARDFEKVVELRKLRDQAETTEDKAARQREALDLLEITNEYAVSIAEHGLRLMEFGILLFEIGWPPIKGDSGVAISSSMASVMSCIFVTNLNIKTLSRRKYAITAKKKIDSIESRLALLQAKAFSCITQSGSDAVDAIELELKED